MQKRSSHVLDERFFVCALLTLTPTLSQRERELRRKK
jgi:hypothetical protein